MFSIAGDGIEERMVRKGVRLATLAEQADDDSFLGYHFGRAEPDFILEGLKREPGEEILERIRGLPEHARDVLHPDGRDSPGMVVDMIQPNRVSDSSRRTRIVQGERQSEAERELKRRTGVLPGLGEHALLCGLVSRKAPEAPESRPLSTWSIKTGDLLCGDTDRKRLNIDR